MRWPSRIEGLVQDPGLPVGAGGAGQRGACFRAALPGEGADLLAEFGGGGDQDRGQGGAGGLADWTALSRPVISSRRASRSPSARICAGAGRASSSRAARTASIGSLLPARRFPT